MVRRMTSSNKWTDLCANDIKQREMGDSPPRKVFLDNHDEEHMIDEAHSMLLSNCLHCKTLYVAVKTEEDEDRRFCSKDCDLSFQKKHVNKKNTNFVNK